MKILARLALAVIGIAALNSQATAGNVFVPLGSAGEVLSVDAEKDSITSRAGNVPDVHGLAITPDKKFLVAGSYSEVEAGNTGLPPRPEGMSEDVHRSHHAPRAEQPAERSDMISYLSIIRAADMNVVQRISVPGAVHHVAITPDSRFAIVTQPNNDGVSVVDLDGRKVIKSITTGSSPNYAAVTPDGRRLFVSNSGDDTISEIETANWTVGRTIPVGETPEHVVMSRDGTKLFVNNVYSGTVSTISLGSASVTKTYEIGGEVHGIDVSEDGKTLFVVARERERLIAVDLATGNMREAVFSPEPYHLTAVKGTGKLYLSSREEPKIWVINQQTLEPITEIQITGEGHQMAVAN